MKLMPLLLLFSLLTWAQPTHEKWTDLLQQYVDEVGNVDYENWEQNTEGLNT